jgi:hypothetical protein
MELATMKSHYLYLTLGAMFLVIAVLLSDEQYRQRDRLTALEQEFRISRATLFEELNRLRAIEPAPVFDEAGRIQHYAGTDDSPVMTPNPAIPPRSATNGE